MEKPTLKLHHKHHNGLAGTLGMRYLFCALKDSGLYNIEFHEEQINPPRGMRASILHCNGKRIYVDFWEYPTPTYSKRVFDEKFDLIIELQHRVLPLANVQRYLNRKNILKETDEDVKAYLDTIVPWTFFPSRLCLPYVNKEEELFCDEVDRLAFFCGKGWRCRSGITKKLEESGIEVIHSSQEKKAGKPLSDEEYVDYMRKSRYGIVLCGRASPVTDFKNRREADYMMMKKPVLMNYKPHYYNELVEGKHYIYIDGDTDISKLEEKYDVDQIAENGHQWYLENMRPDGAAKVFGQIMKDRFDI